MLSAAMLNMALVVRKVSEKLTAWQNKSPKGFALLATPRKVAGMLIIARRTLEKERFMMKSPGTWDLNSELWVKHSSTDKFVINETTVITTMDTSRRNSGMLISRGSGLVAVVGRMLWRVHHAFCSCPPPAAHPTGAHGRSALVSTRHAERAVQCAEMVVSDINFFFTSQAFILAELPSN